MPIEFLSDEAKRKLALFYSTRKASSEKEDFEALLYEIRVLRKALSMACVHMADEIDNYDSARVFLAVNEEDACIEAAKSTEAIQDGN